MPKLVDHDALRREIVLRCFPLFAEEGFANVSIRRIAEAAQVSTGTLYHYFDGKNGIFEEMMRELSEGHAAAALAPLREDADLETRLQRLFDFLRDNIGTLQQVFLVAVDFRRQHNDGEGHPHLVAASQAWQGAVARLLGPMAAGLTQAVYTQLLGMVALSLLDPDPFDTSQQHELLRRALSTRDLR